MMTIHKPTPQSCTGGSHERHKRMLKEKGWSYRTAGEQLGRHWMTIYEVLNGRRKSGDLLKRIEALPAKGASE